MAQVSERSGGIAFGEEATMIHVCLAGATGWVGAPLAAAIRQSDDLRLVAAVARRAQGQSLGELTICGSVAEALVEPADVFVDFTSASSVRAHVHAALAAGQHVVVGTSGLTTSDFVELDARARACGRGVVAAGNFALSAALLQRFATEAARHLPSWEILDWAHADKPDAPSGTARELAARLAEVRRPAYALPAEKTIGAPEARGAMVDGSRVHSLRLPGHTIGVEVRFGLPDERLTLTYDGGPGPEPYLAGALLAIRRVRDFVGVVRGLDRLI
jgi:4-hydroxy-tetrahydrodipicolinate reductase